jgi:GNAT superfamily N-acetyltransferase
MTIHGRPFHPEGSMHVRKAQPAEAGRLSELVMRSKAVWGYDGDFLDAVREQLRIHPDDVVSRRVVVAERDGTPLGVATLDGEPPDGEIGLLFVEPDQMRRGVGHALYRHVLTTAGRLGFRRLVIVSDPHAVPFYLAQGAEHQATDPTVTESTAADGLARMLAWPPAPEPSWSTAWDGGDRLILVGNAAEFNAQFGQRLRGPDHYSCLAAFCAARPAAVLLPMPVEDWWIEHVGSVLGWDGVNVRVYGGVAGDARMSSAIAASRELRQRLAADPSRVRPWGSTAGMRRVTPYAGCSGLATVRRFESKRRANRLFHAVAGEHPGITVPLQRHVRSYRHLMRSLGNGHRLVLKREYGVGGDGTAIVSADTPGLRGLLRRWLHHGDVLMEEYVEGGRTYRDVTFNGVIDAGGWVHPVGVGLMDVDGTAYRGVTVGPGSLPDDLAGIATRFGTAVGRALAASNYHGWFDVDLVAAPSGRLAPTEINLRLTGPAAAFHIQAAANRLHGGRHVVRTVDQMPLGARLPSAALRDHVSLLVDRCQSLGAALVVTIPTAAYDAAPYLGVAIVARTATTVTEAEAVVRQMNGALGDMFDDAASSAPAFRTQHGLSRCAGW